MIYKSCYRHPVLQARISGTYYFYPMATGKSLVAILDKNLSSYDIQFRVHATQRMYQRNIEHDDIYSILNNGNIIEEYPTSYPFPCFLINGRERQGKPLHCLVGIDRENTRLYIITAYIPDEFKWQANFSERRTT